MTTELSQAAQSFFNTDEGKQAILPATAGVEYLYIDVVDFTGQNVDNLFGDKYVIVYVIKDLDPQSDQQLRDTYYQKGILSSLFYPKHVQDKLIEAHGTLKMYASKLNGMTASTFDYNLLNEDDKIEYVEFEESTNYFANSLEARDIMWKPLTEQDIAELKEYANNVVDENIPKLFQVETSRERPYAVNVFNDSVSSFMCSYSTYEECKQVIERIHADKVKTLTSEMAFI